MQTARYIEDFQVGETFETGSHRISVEEAIDYAATYDPQNFHIDERTAKQHPIFKGLSVSGFLVLGITHRLILEQNLGHAWGLIGKQVNDLLWRRPVRPGDTLHVQGRVLNAIQSPDKLVGTLEVDIETLNQNNEVVLSFTVLTVVPSKLILPEETVNMM